MGVLLHQKLVHTANCPLTSKIPKYIQYIAAHAKCQLKVLQLGNHDKSKQYKHEIIQLTNHG